MSSQLSTLLKSWRPSVERPEVILTSTFGRRMGNILHVAENLDNYRKFLADNGAPTGEVDALIKTEARAAAAKATISL